MPGKNTYFISDLHLGAAYIDNPSEHEKNVCRFLKEIAGDASTIYLLGDILDYWYEYRYVVPKGFIRFFGTLAQLSDSGVEIIWLIGNHDIWIFDYLPRELGIKVIDGYITPTINGEKFYLAHGDGLGVNSLGFRFIRSLFRNKICQWLFSGIHPRWTVPFAHNWSSSSRKGHKDYKESKEKEIALSRLETFCREELERDSEIRHFIFGHLHLLKQIKISDRTDMTVIGDWISHFSYAVFDGKELNLLTYTFAEKRV